MTAIAHTPANPCLIKCHAYGIGCGCRPFTPYVPPAQGDATAIVVVPAPRAVRRATVLARLRRRPSRVVLLEAKLARATFVNAGLRGRLAELIEDRDELVDALIDATDETARQLGHQHPAVTTVRAILASVER